MQEWVGGSKMMTIVMFLSRFYSMQFGTNGGWHVCMVAPINVLNHALVRVVNSNPLHKIIGASVVIFERRFWSKLLHFKQPHGNEYLSLKT